MKTEGISIVEAVERLQKLTDRICELSGETTRAELLIADMQAQLKMLTAERAELVEFINAMSGGSR